MLGAFLLAEGLAEPVDDSEPALIIPMRELPRRRLEDRVPLAADMARGVRALPRAATSTNSDKIRPYVNRFRRGDAT